MLTLEAMNGNLETTYVLSFDDPSKPAVIVAGKHFAGELEGGTLSPLTPPNDTFSDAQRLIEMAFSKYDTTATEDERGILEFTQALKDKALFSNEAVQTMGMLVYLGEKNPSMVGALIDPDDVKGSISKVKASFLEEVEREKNVYQEAFNQQYYAGIFDSQITKHIKKIQQIAKLLVTKDGWVNSALIPVITVNCLNESDSQEKETIAILKAMHYATTNASNIPFTEHFADVYVPENQVSEMSDVIRATLQIPLDEQLTKRHCKLAILIALLTHDNKKVPPSLFSTQVLAEKMDRFIVQLSYCIKHAKVNVSGKEVEISWKINKNIFDKKVEISRSGTVSKVKSAYWGQSLVNWWYPPYQLSAVPNFSEAFRMMGLDRVSCNEGVIVERLLKCNTVDSKIVKISEILWEAAAYSIRPKIDIDATTKLYRRGVLGLLSETSCPLLLVWQRFIQKVENTEFLTSRYKRIERCIKGVFSHVVTDKLEQYRIKQIYKLFFSNLNDNLKVYEGFNHLYSSKEALIDSSASFKEIVTSSLNVAKVALLSTQQSDTEKEGYTQLFEKLQIKIIDSHTFSYQFAVAYDPRNMHTINSEEYPYNTPWNEFREFELPTFFTAFDDLLAFKDQTNERPKSIAGFVEKWINTLRYNQKMVESKQQMHPSMKKMMDNSASPLDLLSDHLIQPGLNVSTSEILEARQMKFLECVKQRFIPSSQVLKFNEKTYEIVKKTTMLSIFCKNLLRIVLDCVEMDDGDREKATLIYTNLVIKELLHSKQKQDIIEHMLHLFSSNWKTDEGYPLDIVAFFNPVTSNISLGTFDGKEVKELDQYDMVESGFLHALLELDN